MSGARFDVYGRYVLDVEEQGGRWIVYERGEGKRRLRPDIAIPPEVARQGLAAYLDDLLHEEGRPGRGVREIR